MRLTISIDCYKKKPWTRLKELIKARKQARASSDYVLLRHSLDSPYRVDASPFVLWALILRNYMTSHHLFQLRVQSSRRRKPLGTFFSFQPAWLAACLLKARKYARMFLGVCISPPWKKLKSLAGWQSYKLAKKKHNHSSRNLIFPTLCKGYVLFSTCGQQQTHGSCSICFGDDYRVFFFYFNLSY